MTEKHIMLAKKLITEEEKEDLKKFKRTLNSLARRVFVKMNNIEPIEIDDEIDIINIVEDLFNNIRHIL